MAELGRQYIVISDDEEEFGAEVVSASPLSSVNSMIIDEIHHEEPEDEQINAVSVYANEAAAVPPSSSNSQLIALPSRQASVCVLAPPYEDSSFDLESVITVGIGDTSPPSHGHSYEAIHPRNANTRNSSTHRRNVNMNVVQPAEGGDHSFIAEAGSAQATAAAAQQPRDRSITGLESTTAPIQRLATASTTNHGDTSRSMPIVVESPPPSSGVHVHPHITTSSTCSATNQESGRSLVHIAGAVSGSNVSTQPVTSQIQQITVNARVLDQVVKFAALSFDSLYPQSGSVQQHEIELYRLLTNAEAPPGEPALPLSVLDTISGIHGMLGSASNTHECLSRTSTSSSGASTEVSYSMDDDIIMTCASSPTLNWQCIRQAATSSEPIILDDQSPEKLDTHTGSTPVRSNIHQPSTSTPTTTSEMEGLSLTTTPRNSLSNEISLNSTPTEITLENCSDDECPTPVPNPESIFRSMLRREMSNESTWSQHSAPPRKRPKMTDRNKRAQSVTICGEEVVPVSQAMDPTLIDIGNQELQEVMITNPAPPGRDSHTVFSLVFDPAHPLP